MPRATAALLLSVVLAACSAEPSESVSPSPSPTPEAAASPPGEEPGPACIEGSICDGPIAPGTYTSNTTGALITFTVPDEEWLGQPDTPEVGFALFRDDFGAFTGISVVTFMGEVFADSCNSTGEHATIEASASAFMAWLAETDGITPGEVSETTVGGQPALVMDLTSTLPGECPDEPWLWLWVVPVFGDFHLVDGETARFWAIDVGEATIIIAAEADTGADWDAFLTEATEIIDSMVIELP